MPRRRAEIVLTARDLASFKIRRLGDTVKLVGGIFAFVGATQIGRFFKDALRDAIRTAEDFEFELSKVKAITKATGEEMGRLSEQAKGLGRSTVFTAREVAQAQSNFARAGFSVNEILSVLPGTLNLAAAGELELARAAKITAQLIRSFGKEARDATDIADLLAKTANTANTTVEALGEAFSFAAPSAKVLGVDMTEASAALAILADRGLDASVAGTSLARVLESLLGNLDLDAKGLEDLNKMIFDADGRFIGLTNTLKVLRENGIRAGDAFEIFGKRGGRAMSIFLDLGEDVLQAKIDQLLQRTGESAEQAETRLDNLRGAKIRFKSATESLQIAIGERFNPALERLTKLATGAVIEFEEYVKTGVDVEKTTNAILGSFFSLGNALIFVARWTNEVIQGWKLLLAAKSDIKSLAISAGFRFRDEAGREISGADTEALDRAVERLKESRAGIEKAQRQWDILRARVTEDVELAAQLIQEGPGNFDASAARIWAAQFVAALRGQDIDKMIRSDLEALGLLIPAGSGRATGEQVAAEAGPPALTPQEEKPIVKPHVTQLTQRQTLRMIREQITEENAIRLEAMARALEIEQRAADDLLSIRIGAEQDWTAEQERLEIERLERSYQRRIEEARRVGADTADIERGFEIERQMTEETFGRMREEEQRRRNEQTIKAGMELATAVFGESKSLAVAEAIMNTWRGVNAAMGMNPPNIPLAIFIAATGLANVSKIRKTKRKREGFRFGGMVEGPGGVDVIDARLTRGELVVDTTPSEARSLLGGRAKIVPAGADAARLDREAFIAEARKLRGMVLDGDRVADFFERNATAFAAGFHELLLRGDL